MKAVAILSPQRQVAGKGALPQLSPALCGGRCQVWGGGPPPQKEEPSPRKAGRGAAVRQRQQHTHKAAREEAEGALEGDTACGSGGRGTGAGVWEEAGQGSGPHLPPLCLPSEGGSSDGLGRERGGGSIAQMRPPQLLLPPKSVQSP